MNPSTTVRAMIEMLDSFETTSGTRYLWVLGIGLRQAIWPMPMFVCKTRLAGTLALHFLDKFAGCWRASVPASRSKLSDTIKIMSASKKQDLPGFRLLESIHLLLRFG